MDFAEDKKLSVGKARIKQAVALLMVLMLFALGFFARAYFSGKFTSVEELQQYMKTFGAYAPLVLTAFQTAQVVLPVLPGFLGCAAGSVLFGVWGGFICNYVGICAGSFIAYYLGRKFGIDLVLMMFSQKKYEKWRDKISKSRSFTTFMVLAILLPVFPDDFLCYFSGLVKMDAKKFAVIILLAKPWCILAYSLIFKAII